VVTRLGRAVVDETKGGELEMTIRDRLRSATFFVVQKQDGQTMAEYGAVLGVITVATVGMFALLGTHVREAIDAVMTRF